MWLIWLLARTFLDAGLAELADALGLEPSEVTRVGSSPSSRILRTLFLSSVVTPPSNFGHVYLDTLPRFRSSTPRWRLKSSRRMLDIVLGLEPRGARPPVEAERAGSERKRDEWGGGGRVARARALAFKVPHPANFCFSYKNFNQDFTNRGFRKIE